MTQASFERLASYSRPNRFSAAQPVTSSSEMPRQSRRHGERRNHFPILRLESHRGLFERISKTASVPALLVSVRLGP